MNFYNILLLTIIGVSITIPIPLIKLYTQTKKIRYILLSIVSYLILIYSYIVILDNENIHLYPFVKIMSFLIIILLDVYMSYDKLSVKSYVGVLFGLFGMYLLINDEKQ